VYWLLEIGQHKERIKFSVLLPSILGVNPDHSETGAVFAFWQANVVIQGLQEELPLPESVFAQDDWDDVNKSSYYRLLQEFI